MLIASAGLPAALYRFRFQGRALPYRPPRHHPGVRDGQCGRARLRLCRLKTKNYGFLVVNTYGEIFRQPAFGETVTVETWPLPPRHVFFERDYRVLGEDGQPVAAAASRWCLVDLSTFSLLTGEALGEANTNCPYNPEKSIVVPNWKVSRMQEGKRGLPHRRPPEFVRSLSSRQQHALCRPLFGLFAHAGARRAHPPKLPHLVCEAGERGSELALFAEDRGNELLGEVRMGEEVLTQCRFTFRAEKKGGRTNEKGDALFL